MEEASGDPGANPAGDTNGVDELCDWTIEEEAAVAGCKRKKRQRTRGKGSAGNYKKRGIEVREGAGGHQNSQVRTPQVSSRRVCIGGLWRCRD